MSDWDDEDFETEEEVSDEAEEAPSPAQPVAAKKNYKGIGGSYVMVDGVRVPKEDN